MWLADDLATFPAKMALFEGADIGPQQLQRLGSLRHPSRDRFVETSDACRKFCIWDQRRYIAEFLGRTNATSRAHVQQCGVAAAKSADRDPDA